MFSPATMREKRREARLTQAELALRVGCNRDTVSRVELGRLRPSVALVERIARAVGVAVDALYARPAPGPPTPGGPGPGDGPDRPDAKPPDADLAPKRRRVYDVDERLAKAFGSFVDLWGLREDQTIEALLLWFLGSSPQQRADIHNRLDEWKADQRLSSDRDAARAGRFGRSVTAALRRSRRSPSPGPPAAQPGSPSPIDR